MTLTGYTASEMMAIEKAEKDILSLARSRCRNEQEVSVVMNAFELAVTSHVGEKRRSGEPYIIHPAEVARIVVEDIGLGYKSITAALLHDVVEGSDITTDDIRRQFGDKIASIVEGLGKIRAVLSTGNSDVLSSSESAQADNFRRILLTLNDDVRVVLIKLADRLHNCRQLQFFPQYKRDKILDETMFLFIPLAHRLGLYGIKSEMENIWLKFREPQAYSEICGKIDAFGSGKDKDIDAFNEPICAALDSCGFSYAIKKRIKAPYSIWKKIMEKGVSFEQIYDLFAVRIVFNPKEGEDEKAECFHIFSLISGIYGYKPDRLRNWVDYPKANGYEALHCTFMSNSGIWIEVQIRSKRMDEIAEKGIAAHWLYKEKNSDENHHGSDVEQWISKVKDILADPEASSKGILDIMHNDLVNSSSEIYIFTRKGEQVSIRKGSTAMDYATLCAEDKNAIAAKVNMKLVPLDTVLKSGDQVEIITARDPRPFQKPEETCVRLSIRGNDRVGIINEISRYISLVMGINIKRITIESRDGRFEGELDIFIQSEEALDKLAARISRIEGLEEIKTTKLE